MKKYFFDIVGQRRAEYDFQGTECCEPQKALQLAELIALDVEVAAEDEFSGGRIDVHSPEGHKLFSVPIGELELIAA